MKNLIPTLIATVTLCAPVAAQPYISSGATAVQSATGTSAAVGWSWNHLSLETGVREATSPLSATHGATIDLYVRGPFSPTSPIGGFFTVGNSWTDSKTYNAAHTTLTQHDLLSWRVGAGLSARLARYATLRAAARVENLDHKTLPTYNVDLILGRW